MPRSAVPRGSCRPPSQPTPPLASARYFLSRRRPRHVARGQAAPAPPSNGRYRPPRLRCPHTHAHDVAAPARHRQSARPPQPEGKKGGDGAPATVRLLEFPTPGRTPTPRPCAPPRPRRSPPCPWCRAAAVRVKRLRVRSGAQRRHVSRTAAGAEQ